VVRVSGLFRSCCQAALFVPFEGGARRSLLLSGKVAVFVLRVGSIFVGCFASECGGAQGVSCAVGLWAVEVRWRVSLAGRMVAIPGAVG